MDGMSDTVDGRNPAPVDMENLPLFTGLYLSQVVQDFFHQQYHLKKTPKIALFQHFCSHPTPPPHWVPLLSRLLAWLPESFPARGGWNPPPRSPQKIPWPIRKPPGTTSSDWEALQAIIITSEAVGFCWPFFWGENCLANRNIYIMGYNNSYETGGSRIPYMTQASTTALTIVFLRFSHCCGLSNLGSSRTSRRVLQRFMWCCWPKRCHKG